MSDLILAAAAAGGLAFASIGLSSFALWRGMRAQSSVEASLREGLRRVEESVSAIPPPPKLDTGALEAVRDDVASFGSLLSGIAKGQTEMRDSLTETVTEAMGAAAAELNAQITEADRRALARNEALRDDQQKLAEALDGVGETVSNSVRADIAPITETALALSAQIAALGGAAPAPAPPAPATAVEAAEADVAARPETPALDEAALREALTQAVADAVAMNVATAMETAAATLGEDVAGKLRAALTAEFAAQAARGGAATPARAPSIFNSGRVVTLARPSIETAADASTDETDRKEA
ncbi:hypothetical protein [Rubrimonas cliftonensis]|uniref:Uncharacterized protein n=1 Tax=Rubrimonas cliftonensis TaxID=89524 RepID=A0A1H4ALE4_9RHOB|nr:hypothetical protein [Rubrimonas cliftonensis]SEA36776.1 hypothetical protein SAMN05444370_104281 [Rubrimonas cliftonensis]